MLQYFKIGQKLLSSNKLQNGRIFMSNSITNAFLAQFNTLNNSGILEENGRLKKELKQAMRLQEDSASLLQITSTDGMIEYISTNFLDLFMPSFMCLIIQPPREQAIMQFCYKNIERTNFRIDEKNYFTLKNFFTLGNYTYDFCEIKQKLENDAFTEDFLQLKPRLVFPLKGIGGMYGIAIFSDKLLSSQYTNSDISYIEHIFLILSVIIQNDLHYHSSITDPKTGLYTYDYFMNKLEETLAMVKRYKHDAGVFMLDIDHFKKFNDKYGHLAGDKVLNTLAANIGAILRTEDCFCRFGGEEFAIVVPEIDTEGLKALAERLRKTAKQSEVCFNGEQLKVTISVGAFLVTSSEKLTPRLIISRADQAMYFSKNSGRDCCTIFPDGLLRRAEIKRELNNDL